MNGVAAPRGGSSVPGDFAALPAEVDVLVVGAGPAGMAAGIEAKALGLTVLVADENAAPGGQIYRAITTTPVTDRRVLGASYWSGADLAARFLAAAVPYAPRTTVWSLEAGEDGMIAGLSRDGRSRLVAARHVIAATGALERPMPVPGWTLPGVVTAGGAQTLLKASGMVPRGPIAMVGTGPLMLLVASQLRAAGADIAAMVDTAPAANRRAALPHALAFLRSPDLGRGLSLLAETRRKVRVVAAPEGVALVGTARVEAVAIAGGERIDCDHVLLHQGVVPNTHLAVAMRAEHAWDDDQLTFRPRLDRWGQTSVAGLTLAGDCRFIGGARSAAVSGELAAIGAALALGRIEEAEAERHGAPVHRRERRALAGRAFLDRLYRPAARDRIPDGEATLVCRCEEVTAGAIRRAVAGGATGPNQLKAFLRCGMGPCQGRLCGLTVTETVAAARGVSPAAVGAYRTRSPFKPVTLGEYAALPVDAPAIKAVVR